MDLTKRFVEFIENNVDYQKSLKIVRKNSKGKIWLIGGGVSRNLKSLLYGGKISGASFDFDFIVEEVNSDLILPKGWKIKENRYRNPKFVGEGIDIDFIPIKTISSIKRRKLKPTIKNFLSGTPFTIQSIAFDTKTKKLIGELGINALKMKEFRVNDLVQAKIYASKKGIEINKLIKMKAKSMDFNPIFI